MARISRNTKQKMLLSQELGKINEFFSADELYAKIKRIDKNVGIATIYRFLKEKEKSGELFSYLCNKKAIYSKGKKSHCHFICEKTGKMTHFSISDINFLNNKIPGKMRSFQLEVRGVCDDCDD